MTTKAIRDHAQETLHPDRIICHKDGSITVQDGYFYQHGRTTQGFARRVQSAFPDATILDQGDHWAPWPHHSYFWVRFQPAPEVTP